MDLFTPSLCFGRERGYVFPRAAITKQHRVWGGGASTTDTDCLTVPGGWSRTQVSAGPGLLRAGREHPSPASPLASGGLLVIDQVVESLLVYLGGLNSTPKQDFIFETLISCSKEQEKFLTFGKFQD